MDISCVELRSKLKQHRDFIFCLNAIGREVAAQKLDNQVSSASSPLYFLVGNSTCIVAPNELTLLSLTSPSLSGVQRMSAWALSVCLSAWAQLRSA